MNAPDPLTRRDEDRALILAAAIKRYKNGQRIEIASLAAEFGVGRATAYRWFGDNDHLLAEVLIAWITETFRRQRRENATHLGKARILRTIEGVVRHSAKSRSFATLLAREPKRILKIISSEEFPVREVLIDSVLDLLAEEEAAGHIALLPPTELAAAAIVRFLEAHLYSHAIIGNNVALPITMEYISVVLLQQHAGGPQLTASARGHTEAPGTETR